MINFGEGVSLGPLAAIDKEKLRGWRNEYSTWKWCRQHDLISEKQQDEWFDWQSKDKSVRMYMIHDEQTVPVGVCGLTSIDHINQRAEFSLYIAPNFRGRRLATPALKTLVSHGFSNLGLNHIFGETFEGNPAAQIFESIGFKKEGTRRDFYFRAGRYVDAHLYSILFSEWVESDTFKKEQVP